jgi:hypothetical protein
MAQRQSRPSTIIGRSTSDDAPRVKGRTPRMPLHEEFCKMDLCEERVIGVLFCEAHQPMKQRKHVARIDRAGELALDVLAQFPRMISSRIHRSHIGVAARIRARKLFGG